MSKGYEHNKIRQDKNIRDHCETLKKNHLSTNMLADFENNIYESIVTFCEWVSSINIIYPPKMLSVSHGMVFSFNFGII